MKERPARLQGTDGVRGRVATDEAARRAGFGPIDAFVRKSLITPSFVELYCFAFAKELLATGLASPGSNIVVGFDPRDQDRRLVRAAIEGIAKAGVAPVNVGVMPTPGVGIYMVSSGASGAVVVTASHNPPDQNGIKLFLPWYGLKPFPADDERLTARIYGLEDVDLTSLTPQHQAIDNAAEARTRFEEFFDDPYNSWAKDADFNDTLLVIDSANGAFTELAGPIMRGFGFRIVEEVGNARDGEVNVNCGAALLEGQSFIGPDFISDAGADFRTVDLLQALFHHGRAHKEDILGGRLKVSGAAFDADGDRFYRLEYDPFRDGVMILSGDEIAYHQAWFLRRKLGGDYHGAASFVTTVESDINVSVAAEELGFIPAHTGVGDKWLLWAAGCHLLGAFWEALNENIGDFAVLSKIESREREFSESRGADAIKLMGFLREAEAIAEEHDLDIGALAQNPELITFAIGSEETGHTVTAGRVALDDNRQRIVYFGNGLKSAINTFAATNELARTVSGEDYYRHLHHPFPLGYKRTLPIYYTDRELLRKDTPTWRKLEHGLLAGCRERFGDELVAELRPRAEEPDMIYVALEEKRADDDVTTRAAVFIRNSGTEEKTSVYLRGDERFRDGLDALGREFAVSVAAQMKKPESPYALAELAVLRKLAESGSAEFSELVHLLGDVNPERLLVEMTLKQGFLKAEGKYLALTELGRQVLEALEKRGD